MSEWTSLELTEIVVPCLIMPQANHLKAKKKKRPNIRNIKNTLSLPNYYKLLHNDAWTPSCHI